MKSNLLLMCLFIVGLSFAQEKEKNPTSPAAPLTEEEIEKNPPVPVRNNSAGSSAKYTGPIIELPDVEAKFPEGIPAMKKFIQENVQYPIESVKNKEQGRVYLTFVVEIDGSLSGVDVMRGGVSPLINTEAKRLVRSMPLCIPAENDGAKVRSRCRLPITFTL